MHDMYHTYELKQFTMGLAVLHPHQIQPQGGAIELYQTRELVAATGGNLP